MWDSFKYYSGRAVKTFFKWLAILAVIALVGFLLYSGLYEWPYNDGYEAAVHDMEDQFPSYMIDEYEDGYQDGYDWGYEEGFNCGYEEGYDGWDENYVDGYDDGYEDGYDDAYDSGYDAGLKASEEPKTVDFDGTRALIENNGQAYEVPESGAVLYSNFSETGYAYILDASTDCSYYIKFKDATTGALVATTYVRQGERTIFDLPFGSFDVYVAAGNTWFGETYLFGDNTMYFRSIYGISVELPQGGRETWYIPLFLTDDGIPFFSSITSDEFR